MLPGIGAAQAQFNPNSPMLQAVNGLNMQAGLRSLIDAGDSASYDGSSQLVIDVSGAGSTIRRGLVTTDTVNDMLWTGVPGRNSKDDYFYPGAGIGTLNWPWSLNNWIDTLHYNNTVWVTAGWQYYVPDPTHGGSGILVTGRDVTEMGILFEVGHTSPADSVPNKLVMDFYNGTGTRSARIVSSGDVPSGQWSFYAAIINEAAGTYSLIINDTVTTGALAFVSPDGTGSTNNLSLQASGTNTDQRYANNVIWQGGAIPTAAQLVNLYNLTRPKFGV